jgi:hypothetical protein
MLKKTFSILGALLVSASLALSVMAADMVKGTISKVEDEGRAIVVKTKDGKDVKMKISGSRTALEGIGDRSEFKAGQSVSAEVDGGEAKKVKVTK